LERGGPEEQNEILVKVGVTSIAWRNIVKWATKGDTGLLFLKMIHHFSSSQPRLKLD
jgi:hypothetical protein